MTLMRVFYTLFSDRLLEVLLRWQQINTEEQLLLQRFANTSTNPKVKALAKSIAISQQNISSAVNDPKIKPKALTALVNNLQSQQQQLAKLDPDFKQQLAIRHAKVSDLEKALPKKSGLLILRKFTPFNLKTGARQKQHWLLVWVSRDKKQQLSYQFYDIGEVEKSKALWQKAQKTKTAKAYQALYQYFFAKLDPSLQQVERVYFVAGGFLQLDDPAYWQLADGRYWIERQDIRRLSTARDLLRKTSNKQGKGFVAFGGIDYNAYSKAKTLVTAKQDSQTIKPLFYLRGMTPIDEASRITHLSFLPNSKDEAEEISQYYHKAYPQQRDHKILHSETEIKQLKHPPEVLHLATHALYYNDKKHQQHPLLSSSLAFAGANLANKATGTQFADDGLLNALEVTSLNLDGTRLVTLSACETVKGAVDYFEGVYGLTQAFKVAGVKNVLMTLRKVKDADAYYFMTAFYKNWLKHPKQSLAKALRHTKLTFIHSENKQQADPQFWSPYVLMEMGQ